MRVKVTWDVDETLHLPVVVDIPDGIFGVNIIKYLQDSYGQTVKTWQTA